MATTGTKVPTLVAIPGNIDVNLKRALESLREAQEIRLGRRGDPRDRAITLRELIDSGLAKELKDNPFDPGAGIGPIDFEPNPTPGDSTIPPAVTGLTASAAFTTIVLSWDQPQFGNFAYAEIYRSADSSFSNAQRRDTTTASVYSDSVDYDSTYYYWVRFVSTSDVEGPFGSSVTATTVENIAAVMADLSETLADLPGYSLIATDSELAAVSAVAAVAAIVIKQSTAPTARPDSSSLQANDLWYDTDDGQLYSRNAANSAWVAARDATLVTTVNSLSSTVSTNTSNIATANSNIATLTSENSSRVSEITELEATVTGYSSSSTISAAISSEATTRANADSALSTSITNLTSTVNSNTSAISSEATTRANADSALSTSITNLTSTVNGNSSSITTLSNTSSDIEGNLDAMYVIQAATESNGSVSVAGMVIGSNADSGSGAQSYVQFQADKFAIWNGSSSTAPFIVSGGVVYIDDARIQNGAITNAKIGLLAVDNARIANATITGAKIGNAEIDTAQIANAAITTALIDDAQVTTLKIGANQVTVPASSWEEASETIYGDYPDFATEGVTEEIGNLTISATTGLPVFLNGSALVTFATSDAVELSLWEGTNELVAFNRTEATDFWVIQYVFTPTSTANYTFYLKLRYYPTNGTSTSRVEVEKKLLTAIQTKR